MSSKSYYRLDETTETETTDESRLDECKKVVRNLDVDLKRVEEPWNTAQEELIDKWRTACDDLSVKHQISAESCKKKHSFYGLPSLIIPLLMTPISATFKDESWISYIEMSAFMLSGVASAMLQFYNFSGKKERHFAFSARYADLVTDIEQEMAKPRQFRQEVDTFSLKIKMLYDALNRSAPDL